MDALLLSLTGLVASLAALGGLLFFLLTLGCAGAFVLFLTRGSLGLAATQVPAILVMSLAAWGCWKGLRGQIKVLDALLKEGTPSAPPPLVRRDKLRLLGLDLAVLALSALVFLQAAALLRRAPGDRPSAAPAPAEMTATT